MRAPLWIAVGAGAIAGLAITYLLLPPPEGRVAFALDPPHAEVALLVPEGRRALTPGPGGATSVLAAGPHRAEVSAPGFKTRAVDFEVAAGELREVDVRLAPAVGSVRFEGLPGRARLEVIAHSGGEAIELPLVDGGWSGELEVGAWVARASAPGYQEESVPFEVGEAEPTRLPIRLHAVARASRRAAEPAVRHEAAVVPVPVPVPAPYWAPGYYGPRFGPRPPRPPVPRPPRPPRPPFP